MNAHSIRYWLVRRPQPTTIKVYAGEQVSELSRAEGQTWSDLANTIEALDPDKIEVYNAANKLIRACRSDDEEVEAAADAATGGKPKAVSYDAETERMKVFATLLAEAYKFAVGVAFDRLTDMLNSNVQQTGNLWRTLEQSNRMMARVNQELVDQALEVAEEKIETAHANADPAVNLLGHFLTGQAQGAAEAAKKTNGAKAPSNGKGQI